jgi:superfamily I DNA/RNA helicase
MPIAARTIGGPGAGKTRRGLEIVDRCLERMIPDPLKIGYVSFTRAARREASTRAAERFNMNPKILETEGWFRTLHSVCHKQLAVSKGELLVGGKDDNEWLRNSLGSESVSFPEKNGGDDYLYVPSGYDDCGRALSLWDVARNRLCSLQDVWRRAADTDHRTPDLGVCEATIAAYEAAKKKDMRLDFADLLMLFAGYEWTGNAATPFVQVEPRGEVPAIPVWIHDEAQDMSLLTARVFDRLTRDSVWVYLLGDDWQSIYSWAGADGSIFANWNVAKEEVLPLSHRCGSRILEVGTRIMERGGCKPRQFSAAREGGDVLRTSTEAALASIRHNVDTLVLARTNDGVRRAAAFLDQQGVPWKSVKVGDGPQAPARTAGVAAICQLRNGKAIDGEAWWKLLALLPSKHEGSDLFVRGSKTWFDDAENRKELMPASLADCSAIGATPFFRELVSSGKYKALLDDRAALLASSAERHGIEAVQNPMVRLGTCHGSKGMEADHVVAINQIPRPTKLAMEDMEGMAEERRVWYVTATRARHQLTIAHGDGEAFEDL